MAVYTEVSDADLEAFLADYDIGQAESFKGIAEGVENTNYVLSTTLGQYMVTLYEKRVDPRDLPFFLGLMDHLAERGINCPRPIHGRDGEALRTLAGRPAAITTFLQGLWPRRMTLSPATRYTGRWKTTSVTVQTAATPRQLCRSDTFSPRVSHMSQRTATLRQRSMYPGFHSAYYRSSFSSQISRCRGWTE